ALVALRGGRDLQVLEVEADVVRVQLGAQRLPDILYRDRAGVEGGDAERLAALRRRGRRGTLLVVLGGRLRPRGGRGGFRLAGFAVFGSRRVPGGRGGDRGRRCVA